MSSFVYDNLPVPGSKVDAGPIRGSAQNNITAAEFNQVTQAVKDLRSALLGGQYLDLAENPSVGVSAAGKSRLRVSGGRVQFSENGGNFISPLARNGVIFNAMDFGCVGDGAADDYAAAQACIAAAEAHVVNGKGAVAYFPAGKYAHSQMLRLGASGAQQVSVIGDGPTATQFAMTGPGFGPCWFVGKETVYPFVPSLIPGDTDPTHFGFVMKSNNVSGAYYLNLMDSRAAQSDKLNGASGFGWAGWFQPAASQPGANNQGHVMGSSGRDPAFPSTDISAWQLFCNGSFNGVSGGNYIQWKLKTTTTTYTLTSTSGLPAYPAVSHVELSYNGSTMRIFINGVQCGSLSATGTVVFSNYEQTTLGSGQLQGWPDGTPSISAWDGTVFGIKIWNTAQHTSNFTPPVGAYGWSANGTEQVLLNFWSPCGLAVGGRDSTGTVGQFVVRGLPQFDQIQTGNLVIKGIGIAGNAMQSGVYIRGAISSVFRDLYIQTGGTFGINHFDQSYFTRLENMQIYTNANGFDSRYPSIDQPFAGVMQHTNAGYVTRDIYVRGAPQYAFAAIATRVNYTSCIVTPQTPIIAPFYAQDLGNAGCDPCYTDCGSDFEGNGNGAECGWKLIDCRSARFNACGLNVNQAKPMIKWRANNSSYPSCTLTLIGNQIVDAGGETAVVDVDTGGGTATLNKLTSFGNNAVSSPTVFLSDPHSKVGTYTHD